MLKVLLINDRPISTTTVEMTMQDEGYDVTKTVKSECSLVPLVEGCRPDVLVYDIEKTQPAILEEIGEINDVSPVPVVMFTDDDKPGSIQAAIKTGVHAYVVDRQHGVRVKSIIDVALERFKTYSALQARAVQAETKLEERKKIDRAKGIWMKQHGVSEPEAYEQLRKMAMDRKIKMVDLADKIIEAHLLLN